MSDYQIFREITLYLRQQLFENLRGFEGIALSDAADISLDSPAKLSDGNGSAGDIFD